MRNDLLLAWWLRIISAPVAQFGEARPERNEEAVITDPVVYMGRGTYDPGLVMCVTEQGGNRE